MDKVLLNVLGLSYSQSSSGSYALILSEEEGEYRIPIIIGSLVSWTCFIRDDKLALASEIFVICINNPD